MAKEKINEAKEKARKELLDAAFDFIKTKAGEKVLGFDLDIENLKKRMTKEEGEEPTPEKLKERLKEYIPKLEEYEIKGRIYDKYTTKPIVGAKVIPILALGDTVFTDKDGEFTLEVEIPILPFNNKALVQSKAFIEAENYLPLTGELITESRSVKTNLKTKPLINLELAVEEEELNIREELNKGIEKAANVANSAVEKVLLVRQKQVEKLTNTIMTKLIPLAIGLLLIFGITKIKDRGKKICPTPDQLRRAVKKRNSIARQLNQLYALLAINVALAVLFNYIAIQLRGVKTQISSLSFPTAVPPGVGVPYFVISLLENLKDLIQQILDQNKKLNIALIIALIFFVIAMIILVMILKTVDSLIFECAEGEKINLVELNKDLRALAEEDETEDNIITPDVINGFKIEVIELDKNRVGNYKRRQAVGKNQQGVILVRGDQSFSSSDTVLKNELIFYIKSNDLKAY